METSLAFAGFTTLLAVWVAVGRRRAKPHPPRTTADETGAGQPGFLRRLQNVA